MILITGATGYIGSHTWVSLLSSGYEVVGIDNFSNSNPFVLDRISQITGCKPHFFEGDLSDINFLKSVFQKYKIFGVIHFASHKAVSESVQVPLKYYGNNIVGLVNLLEVMRLYACKTFVFSSSATVYDSNNPIPYVEGMPLNPGSPYGWTKYMCEKILGDLEISDSEWSVACLRYFNPVGAHESGLIGEDPSGVPNNLMPYITQVAVGRRDFLSIYGGDWSTHDGTCVRDYIHVMDLALGHLKALSVLTLNKKSFTVNLGTGIGWSVLDVVRTFQYESKKLINYQIVSRRDGDIACYYADVTLAKKILNWSAQYDLNKICQDSWRWQSKNPYGYEGS